MNISCPRRNPLRIRFLAGALLLAVTGAALAVAVPAEAQASPSSGSPAPGLVTWSVSPASATAPDSRSVFSYGSIKPGTFIFDHVAVLNRSHQAVAFSIYATDATGTTASGALTLLPANQKPEDIGSWATFPGHVSQLSVVIPPGRGVIEPFTIAVPRRATPGDHTGGMIAAVGVRVHNTAGQAVTLYQRIAVPIELRVTGKLVAALRVESTTVGLSTPINPLGSGSTTVSYNVTNTGNVRLGASQVVTVAGPFGTKTTIRPGALRVVLPGDSIHLTVKAGATFPAGPVTAHVTATPTWPPNSTLLPVTLTAATASSSLFAVPWALLVLIILLAGGGYAWWRTTRRRRQAHEAEVAAAADRARRDTERRLLGTANSKSSAKTARNASAKAGPAASAKTGPAASAKAGPAASAKTAPDASAAAGPAASAKAGPDASAKVGPAASAKTAPADQVAPGAADQPVGTPVPDTAAKPSPKLAKPAEAAATTSAGSPNGAGHPE